jgi:acyl-[acyl-carrier-protein]-phospholipid O-acyltransferase / long-chain-fatty-acid--[acyl-carrier-protein] ligase
MTTDRTAEVDPTEEAALQDGGLLSRSFLALLVTQFLVSLNDNMFRWLVIPIGKDLIGQDRALALGGALFLLPFVVFTAPAGFLADRFSKRAVIIGCKVAEIGIMALGVVAIISGSITLMLVALFLMGTQSAIFSPSKFGCIPEIVRHDRISAANGWVGMTTMFAVILGTVAGGFLYSWTTPGSNAENQVADLFPGQYRWWISGTALLGVALLGWVSSLLMGHLKPANPKRPVPWNPAAQTYRDLSALFANRPLLLAALGSAYFWTMGVLAQSNIDKFARPELVVDQQYVGFLLAMLTLGIGLGAVLAGLWSRGRVEVGLTPIGAAGIGVSLLLLTTVPAGTGEPFSAPYAWACLWLLGLGVSAGLYDIPLLSFLQERSPQDSRGRVLAAYNFLAFSGMFLATGIFWVLASLLGLSARQIFLVCGLLTLGVMVYIAWLIPLPLVRVIFGGLIKVIYRVRVYGRENVPQGRGAILVSNHISWIDGLLLGYLTPRRVVMVADRANLKHPVVRRLTGDGGVIGFSPNDRRSVLQTVRFIRQLLQDGRVIHVFAEGGISRTNQILGFNSGFLTMQKGTGVPVVPMACYGLWGSLLTFSEGRFFRKWPRFRRLAISVEFGEPIYDPPDVQCIREAIQQLTSRAARRREHYPPLPPGQWLRICRRNRQRIKWIDPEGRAWTGGHLLRRALLWRRLLRRHLPANAGTVAVAMRPSMDTVAIHAALALDGRTVAGVDADQPTQIAAALEAVGSAPWLVDRRSVRGWNSDMAGRVQASHALLTQATKWDRLAVWFQSRVVPVAMLERWFGVRRTNPDQLLAILFSEEGSGTPVGIQLTHGNVASNVDAFCETLFMTREDRLMTHGSFSTGLGWTLGLWSGLLRDHGVVLPSESDRDDDQALSRARSVATILVARTESLQAALDASPAKLPAGSVPDQGDLLRMVLTAGAPSLELADAFEQRFGVRPYGMYVRNELSPVAAINVPPQPQIVWQVTCRDGSVGRALPGVTPRVVDPETGIPLGSNQTGMLQIQGPNIMLGYWQQPEATEQVICDGWFVTGDLARIDGDGFLHLVESSTAKENSPRGESIADEGC